MVTAARAPCGEPGFFNEYRAEVATAALRAQIGHEAGVRRDGRAGQVPVTDLVPGDVVTLRVGSIVPADLRLLAGMVAVCLLLVELAKARFCRAPAPAARGPRLRGPNGRSGASGVEPARRFHFRTEPDTPTGTVAANLAELEAELGLCDEGVLRHHCPGHDFSRWAAGVFRDGSLAADLAAAEASLTRRSPGAVVEQVRLALIAALQDRHPR